MIPPDLSWVLPLVFVFLFIVVMIVVTFRRAFHIRNRTIALSDRHDRLLLYAQSRIGAQKEQAAAARAETDAAKAAHLRQAIEFWRQANRHRDPDDRDAYEDIIAQIAMLEEDLAALAPPAPPAPEAS